MESVNRHLAQWKHNREFLTRIEPKYNDWIVTVTFYAALHAVDLLLLTKNNPVDSHTARNDTLSRTNTYSQIWKHYQPLYSLCRSIRYFANPGKWVPFDQIETQVICRYLYPIEKSVQRLTKQDFELPKIELRSP